MASALDRALSMLLEHRSGCARRIGHTVEPAFDRVHAVGRCASARTNNSRAASSGRDDECSRKRFERALALSRLECARSSTAPSRRERAAHTQPRAQSRAHINLIGALALAWAVGCPAAPPVDDTDAIDIPPPPYDSLEARPCPPDSALTWENFGQPYVTSWCTACHSSALDEAHRAAAPVDVNFNDLDGVRAQAPRIWARSGDQNNTMPPAGVAPAVERAQLGEWLACGAASRDD